jgi:hypothetical protein
LPLDFLASDRSIHRWRTSSSSAKSPAAASTTTSAGGSPWRRRHRLVEASRAASLLLLHLLLRFSTRLTRRRRCTPRSLSHYTCLTPHSHRYLCMRDLPAVVVFTIIHVFNFWCLSIFPFLSPRLFFLWMEEMVKKKVCIFS